MRLRALTELICGDDRPKQFCPLWGGVSLLRHARRRAERSLPSHQVLYSLTKAHERFYLPELEDCPSQRVVQPSNKGTAPGIVSGLLRIAEADRDAIVAILPSDHQFANEALFTENLDSAFYFAEQRRKSIILLGARPDSPETGYGWIEPGKALRGRSVGLSCAERFHEKPPMQLAQRLLDRNSLWNTFVMVGSVQAFLKVVRSTVPDLLLACVATPPSEDSDGEVRISTSQYQHIPHTDFSRQVLSASLEQLLVFPLGPVGWSDLGDPSRALEALSRSGVEPDWAGAWRKQNARALRVASTAVA